MCVTGGIAGINLCAARCALDRGLQTKCSATRNRKEQGVAGSIFFFFSKSNVVLFEQEVNCKWDSYLLKIVFVHNVTHDRLNVSNGRSMQFQDPAILFLIQSGNANVLLGCHWFCSVLSVIANVIQSRLVLCTAHSLITLQDHFTADRLRSIINSIICHCYHLSICCRVLIQLFLRSVLQDHQDRPNISEGRNFGLTK